MLDIGLAVVLGGGAIVAMLIVLSLKYKSFFNPAVFFVVYYSVPLVFISYANSLLIGVDEKYASLAYNLSVIYILSFCAGAIIKSKHLINALISFSKYTISSDYQLNKVVDVKLRLKIGLSLCLFFYNSR